MEKLRFVLDTNVLISAALFKNSKPDFVLQRVLHNGRLFISPHIHFELKSIFESKKLDKYLSLEDRRIFLSRVLHFSDYLEPKVAVGVCRDPNDNDILALAISGNVHVIISGDQDLLTLNPFEHIPIMTPKEFLDFPI